MLITDTDLVDSQFLSSMMDYYVVHGRHSLPWRLTGPTGRFDPYQILVSEIMLQQTQVERVLPKFLAFLEIFPTVQTLAAAPLGEVLIAWSGLGYNRRAKFLWQATQQIVADYAGQFPDDPTELIKLPGVGPNTAGAILAYAFNKPGVFIETNIRTVYIHHYFADRTDITDAELRPIIERTLDANDPRQFYWALMDYGSYLKRQVGNLTKLSKSYSKQSPFAGSSRQIRGQVIRLLTSGPRSRAELTARITDPRLPMILTALENEKLIVSRGATYTLTR